MSILFGLAAALAWGTSDFLGGRFTTKYPVLTVGLVSQATSCFVLLVVAAIVRPELTGSALAWGLAAGLFTSFGGISLYQGLATGDSAVVAPLSACGAIVPVVFAFTSIKVVSQASVQVTKDGKPFGIINSEKRQHFSEPAPGVKQKSFEPSTEVGIRSNLQEDLYIVYAGSVEGTEEAVYRFTINPLVLWIWIGGVVLLVGGLITMWPSGTVSAGAVRRGQAGYEVQLAGSGSQG